MHILFLTQIIPYPPDAGPKVKTWHVLRFLAERGHKVTLVSYIRPDEEPYVHHLQSICSEVYTVPIQRSRIKDLKYLIRSYLTGRPFLVERDDLGSMRSVVSRLLNKGTIDVIHADQLTMAQFAFPTRQGIQGNGMGEAFRGPYVIFDAHNATWTIVERMSQTAPWYLKPVLANEAKRVKQYEGLLIQKVDHTLAVTEIDRQALLQVSQMDVKNGRNLREKNISVIPIAVDTNTLKPILRETGSFNILTLGTLHYLPNADGIRWFAKEVFPLIQEEIPKATLTIVGKNPPSDFLQLADRHQQSIKVTGYVPNLRPYFEKAALIVVPVRAGGGMRVRILEAFSQAMPVVTTTVGLEGIQARPGKDVLVEDTPEGFARAVVNVLRDGNLQEKLASNGRRLAESRYNWQVVLQKLDNLYRRINLTSENGHG